MAVPDIPELIAPLFKAMHQLGGSATIAEQEERVAALMGLSDADLSEQSKDKSRIFSWRLSFARTQLKRCGMLDNAVRGVWALTDEGQKFRTVNGDEINRRADQIGNTSSQKKRIYKHVQDLCNQLGSRTFTLPELYEYSIPRLMEAFPSNQNLEEKIRQQLQALRDEGRIDFHHRGYYTLLLGGELLEVELQDARELDISQPPVGQPAKVKREHLMESYARNPRWVKAAIEKYGSYCMLGKCQNTFKKPAGTPYIEVHHIVPLFEGGADGLWNLSVLCAHHHKMAHFADDATRQGLRDTLQSMVGGH